MQKSLFSAALTAVVAASVVVPAASASAQRLVIADSGSDTWQEVYSEGATEPTYTETGTQPNADIRKVVVRHGDRRVLIRTRYDVLTKGDDMIVNLAKIRTNEGVRRVAYGFKVQGTGASAFLFKRTGEAKCAGLDIDIDWQGDTIDLTVPRSCLSKPRWVQVVVAAVSSSVDETTEEEQTFVDVAGKTGYGFTGWTAKVRRG